MTPLMIPGWKPLTISASGSSIDSSRYASSALTVLPFVSSTIESNTPLSVGPTPLDPSMEWQLEHPSDAKSDFPFAALRPGGVGRVVVVGPVVVGAGGGGAGGGGGGPGGGGGGGGPGG